MGFTELITNRRFAPGPGVTKPTPKKGVKRFFFIFYNHFWKLITLNLLFLAFCIPVVTIPAALCGANRVLILLVQEGNCFLWRDFIKEFKSSFFKSLPFGLLYAFLLLDSVYALGISMTRDNVNIWTATVAFLLFGAATLFFSYVFVFIPSLPLKNKHIAKNAFIFMLTEWKTNLILLASTIALIALLMILVSYIFIIAFVLLIFIYFTFGQLIICVAIDSPMQKRIIKPYEQNQKECQP